MLGATAAIVICAASATAGDWYVDAVNGSNANSGTSASDAWRTITHALATTPPAAGETQVIHVARGLYDAALGELFPLNLERGFVVSGPLDRSAVIDGGGAAITLATLGEGTDPGHTSDVTGLERCELRSARRGVTVSGTNPSAELDLRDLRVNGMLEIAIAVQGTPHGIDVSLERVTATSSAWGLTAFGAGQASSLLVEDCSFTDNQRGASLSGCCSGALQATFRRCVFASNTDSGISASTDLFGGLAVTFEDSLIAANGSYGWDGNGGFDGGALNATFLRSTIARNGGRGISGLLNTHASVDGCIVWSNGDDIAHSSISITYSDIQDGDGAGTNGNFSADPLFVDAAGGDYRLSWSSPCIESGDPATTPGTLDLARNARPIDGELDTLERFDVGAFEFAPLFLRSTGELGTLLQLELWGPQGNATTVYFTRRPLVPAQTTPFGELDLDPAFMQIYRVTTVGSGPPKFITRPIPNDLSLIGRVFSFQALTDCAAAPNGKAYTNPVELSIVP